MPRPTWTPKTDEQRAALAVLEEAVAAARQADEVALGAHAEVSKAVEAARRLRVPVREVMKRTGVGRATVYRRLGKNEPDSDKGASTS